MHLVSSLHQRSWRAKLALAFEQRESRTVLAARSHDGPLVVQKPLYPEGDEVCHAIIVHPPAGIAGGDELNVDLRLGAGAKVLVTTPGAGKWYRSAGPPALQRNRLAVGFGACLEWLPQETIVFNGALGALDTIVDLQEGAVFVGWEIVCLGRTGSREKFDAGEWRARMEIRRNGKPVWLERSEFIGSGAALGSEAILAEQPVTGSFIAAASSCDHLSLDPCRAAKPLTGAGMVTRLPQLIVGRYLGGSSQAARNYFAQLWRTLRPGLVGRPASEPRIWRT